MFQNRFTMIPNFTESGELPSGVYYPTWKEFISKYGYNEHRKNLIAGLLVGLRILKDCGCEDIYIDGSFITIKIEPKDIDVCYNTTFLNFEKLDKNNPEFFDPKKGKYLQNKKYGCDFITYNSYETDIITFLSYNRNNEPKGILKFYLKEIMP
jgi:hypothetical protein